MPNEIITTHSARVQEILRHVRAKRQRSSQDKTWRRLSQIGVGRSPDGYTYPQIDRIPAAALREGMWQGRRCFIVGGGPSLKGFDWTKLRGELTIAINRAFEYLDADILFAMDSGVHDTIMSGRFGDAVRDKFERFSGLKVWLDSGVKGVLHLRNNGLTGLSPSLEDGLSTGGNSGYAALNLAILLGANPIYLLGFDMKGDGQGGQAWFHNGYPTKQSEDVYGDFIKAFDAVAPEIRSRGIDVINLNPESGLKCFPFGKFEDIEASDWAGYEYHAEWDSRKVIPRRTKDVFFSGWLGLGDNFFQREIIKDLARSYETVFMTTTFPELYWDIPNVRFVRPPHCDLRTQGKHLASLPADIWVEKPEGVDVVRADQVGPPSRADIRTRYVELENDSHFDFTFPVRNAWLEDARKLVASLPLQGKKLCIVRRPTLRAEWKNAARNPKAEHYQVLIDRHRDEYFFLGIADIEDGKEWFDGEISGIDLEFNRGEIPLTTILGLIKIADLTITYPSLFMIAAIAEHARCFCIFGGECSPEKVLRLHARKGFDLRNFGWAAPDPFCCCHRMEHDCNKEIPREKLTAAFDDLKGRPLALKTVRVGVSPGLGDSHWIMTKMESFRERNAVDHLVISTGRDYSAEYLKLLPFVDEVEKRERHFNLAPLYDEKNPRATTRFHEGVDWFMDAGALMWIRNLRLTEIIPEYETNFHYPIRIPEADEAFARDLKAQNGGQLVLFYTSSIGNNENWNPTSWKMADWLELGRRILALTGSRPVIIGQTWDSDYSRAMAALPGGDALRDMTGQTTMAQTLAMIREASLVVAFPCGIPIMGVTFGRPTVCFWPVRGISDPGRFNKEFMRTWVPPDVDGPYLPVAYGSPEARPEAIFERVRGFLS